MQTKKTLTASILNIVFNLLSATANSIMAFLLWIVISLGESLSEDGISAFAEKALTIILAISSIICLINVGISIATIVSTKRKGATFDKSKKIVLSFIILICISLILYIAIIVLALESYYSIFNGIFAIINIISLILLISEYRKNLKSNKSDTPDNSIQLQ